MRACGPASCSCAHTSPLACHEPTQLLRMSRIPSCFVTNACFPIISTSPPRRQLASESEARFLVRPTRQRHHGVHMSSTVCSMQLHSCHYLRGVERCRLCFTVVLHCFVVSRRLFVAGHATLSRAFSNFTCGVEETGGHTGGAPPLYPQPGPLLPPHNSKSLCRGNAGFPRVLRSPLRSRCCCII